jgi:hypothetical protein
VEIVKNCNKCKESKDLSEFHKQKSTKDGLRSQCKKCRKGINKKYNEDNKEEIALYYKKYYEDNKDKFQQYREDNKEELALYQKKYYEANKDELAIKAKEYQENNRGTINAITSKYRATKLNASPTWSNKQAIRDVYTAAKALEEETGIKYHVDHIVPLQGKNVCGLHIATNLQILTATENISKSNTF